MGWIYFNPNPMSNRVGDCTIRALSLALDQDWDSTYLDIVVEGFIQKDMPSSNTVWSDYLISKGFKRYIVDSPCRDCYTIKDFTDDHPNGVYILATGTHVICVKDGNYYDTWDSGNEIPIYYFVKEQNQNGK